jgi:hypothetical protein
MNQDLVNEIIDEVLHCVQDQTILKAILDGKPWPKALHGETGSTWTDESSGVAAVCGFWHATSSGIKITDRHGVVLKFVRPSEIMARAKTYTKISQPAS